MTPVDDGETPAPSGSRAPSVVGAIAIAVGGVLLAVSGSDRPVRPRVLGDVLVATTTTTTADAPRTAATAPAAPEPAPVVRPARPARPVTSVPPTSVTSTTAPVTDTTEAVPPTSSPDTTLLEPCPTGEPLAEPGAWDASADGAGTWYVTVPGVVTNPTGADVEVDAIAVVVTRADGSTYEIDPAERPVPDPRTVPDGGTATWRFVGQLPPGEAPTSVDAAVTTWRYADPVVHDRCA